MRKTMQFWSVEETDCLVEIWSSSEIQQRLKGTTASRSVFRQIQQEMAAKGHDRELKQIINKIQKLIKEYNEQKNDSTQSRDFWVIINPYYETLDTVLRRKAAQQLEEPEDNTVPQSSSDAETGICKQYWCLDETACLLEIWATSDVQKKLAATRTKRAYEDILRGMTAQGHQRTLEQICNRIKKLKREYWTQKNDPTKDREYWVKRNPHFEIMDSVLSRAAAQPEPVSNTVNGPDIYSDMVTIKQMWSVPETNFLLDLWSSVEVQEKLDGANRTKHVYEEIHRKMVAQGYKRTLDQIIYKLTRLKQQYRTWKSQPNRKQHVWIARNKYAQVLASVLGDTAEDQPTGAGSSETLHQDNTQSSTDSDESIHDDTKSGLVLPGLQDCSASVKMEATEGCSTKTSLHISNVCSLSPAADVKPGSVHAGAQACSAIVKIEPTEDNSMSPNVPGCSSSSPQSRPGKRKREDRSDMLECLERHLQHSREMHEAFLNKMDTHMTAMLGLMGRMVAAMEAQAGKPSQQ